MIAELEHKKCSKKEIKNIIRMELEKLQYNFGYNGTKYLVEAIYLLYSTKKYNNFSLDSDVYKVLANKYGSSPNAIKGVVNYATDKMYYDCDEIFLNEYFKSDDVFFLDDEKEGSKPGTKKVIRTILRKIKDL